jgi:hypothetical protein
MSGDGSVGGLLFVSLALLAGASVFLYRAWKARRSAAGLLADEEPEDPLNYHAPTL